MSELAEGARLEIVCAVNSGTEGSNPSLSAILLINSDTYERKTPGVTIHDTIKKTGKTYFIQI